MKKLSSRLLLAVIAISLSFPIFQNCGQSSHTDLSSEGETLDVLNEKSQKIRLANCASCHDGSSPQAEPSRILDDQWLIDNRWIVPGDAQGSPLFQSLFSGMPKGATQLNENKIGVLERWIDMLALDGRNLANIAISDGLTYDFGSVTTGSTAEHAFTLTNLGDVTALGIAETGLAAPFRFKGGSFPGTGATCLPVLAGKTSCTIVVEYAPSSSGNHSETIEINYHNGLKVQTAFRPVMGSSTGTSLASLTLSPSTNNYGPVSVIAPSDKSFTLTNSGAATASGISASALGAPFAFKGGSFPGTGGTCSTSLVPGASCSIIVRFAPTANGSFNSNLIVNYNDGASPRTVSSALSGSGSGAGSPVYYSTVRAILNSSCAGCHGSTSSESWGSTYSSLMAFKKSGLSSAAIVPGSLSASRFVKRITQDSAGEPQMGISPRGNLSASDKQKILDWIAGGALNDPSGGTPANLTISDGPTFNFGNVVSGSNLDKTFTVTNTGGTAASDVAGSGPTAPFSFKGGSFPGTGGNCSNLIAIGGSCTIVISFAPTSPAAFTGAVTLNYKSGSVAKQTTRQVTGTGTGVPLANLTLNGGAEYDFGAVTTGSTKDKTMTLSNVGSAKATAISGSGLTGVFKWKGGSFPGTGGTCTTALNAGASCTVVVIFSPTGAGSQSASASVNYNNGASSKVVSVIVKGMGVSAGSVIYYSQVRRILTESCSSCHSADWGTTFAALKAFKRPGQTTSALAGGLSSRFALRITGTTLGAQMGQGAFGSLSVGDRAKLLAWISAGMPNDPAGTLTQDFRPLLGDRYYVSSVLKKVYGDNATLVRPHIKAILDRADTFGASCQTQDIDTNSKKNIPYAGDSCFSSNSAEMRLDAESSPFSSTVRESTRLTTCLRIANAIATTTEAMSAAGLSSSATIDEPNIAKLFNAFNPGTAPDPAALEDLVGLGQAAMNRSEVVPATPGDTTKRLEGWRFIHLAICMSPGWQTP